MSNIPVFAFVSVKGGVGKSALCVAAAAGLAARGRIVAVVDCDLTGTSLADGLALRAPERLDTKGHLRWGRPTETWLDLKTTRQRRMIRELGSSQYPGVPFVDDILFGGFALKDPKQLAWKHDELPGTLWYPSSPVQTDVDRAVRVIMGKGVQPFIERLRQLIDSLSETLPEDSAILVDLPPAMYGYAAAMVRIFENGDEAERRFFPVLVSTPDRNDLFRSAHQFSMWKRDFHNARWLLNRNMESIEVTKRELADFQIEDPLVKVVERHLVAVGWDPIGLGRLYRSDRIELSSKTSSTILGCLGIS